jgi:hypothetical protein
VFAFPATSLNLLAATSAVMVPDALAVGATTIVALRPLVAIVNVPLVPPVTVTSSAMKPVTASVKVNVKVTLPVAVVAVVSSVTATVGAVVSVGADASPPPPQAVSKAAAANAQAESWYGNGRMVVSWWLIFESAV